MSIQFACACGRSFAVPDGLAGKWTRCSSCNAKIQVPAATAETDYEVLDGPPPAAPPPPPMPGNIAFKCGCGQPLEVEAEYARQQVECPTCGKLVTAPAAGPTRAKRVIRAEPEEEEDDAPRRGRKRESTLATDKYMQDARRRQRRDDERESRTRSESGSSRMIALIVGGLMILGGIGLFVLMMQGGGRFRIGPILLVVFGLINVVYGLTGQEE